MKYTVTTARLGYKNNLTREQMGFLMIQAEMECWDGLERYRRIAEAMDRLGGNPKTYQVVTAHGDTVERAE
jgi:hypothetical protein